MKKVLFFTIVTLLSTTLVIAQDDNSSASSIKLGAKAGVNLSSANGDDVKSIDGRAGLHIGGVVNFPFTELFSLQPEVIFSMRGWKDGNNTIKLTYVEAPVMASFEIVDGLSLQGGPVIGVNLSAKVENGNNENDIDDISTF